jgi:hypothetical protein
MPYINCPHCRVTNYVARSYLKRGEQCPACEQPLGERAGVVAQTGAEAAAEEAAYRCWARDYTAERRMSFAVYEAALDQEECAAIAYSGAVNRLVRFLWHDPELDPSPSRAA